MYPIRRCQAAVKSLLKKRGLWLQPRQWGRWLCFNNFKRKRQLSRMGTSLGLSLRVDWEIAEVEQGGKRQIAVSYDCKSIPTFWMSPLPYFYLQITAYCQILEGDSFF